MNTVLTRLQAGQSLARQEARQLIESMIDGRLSAEQVGEHLLALRKKNETVDELLGFVDGLAAQAQAVEVKPSGALIDVCGTGGDGAGTFNVSTAVALVLASLGIDVAKHGNRGVSSASGSSDVLEILGIGSQTTSEQAHKWLQHFHVTFLFAPAFHPVLAKLAPIRKSLGVSTIFNALGPLLNPAPLTHQLMGVYHRDLLPKAAEVLKAKGLQSVWVVHGCDGLDEVTLSGPTQVAQLQNGVIHSFSVSPADFGLAEVELAQVQGGNPTQNAEIIQGILNGERSARRDLVLINAAAALVLLKRANTFVEGVAVATQALDSGKTKQLLADMQQSQAL